MEQVRAEQGQRIVVNHTGRVIGCNAAAAHNPNLANRLLATTGAKSWTVTQLQAVAGNPLAAAW
jgi:hypothetical protein